MFEEYDFVLEYKADGKILTAGADCADYSVSEEKTADTLVITLHPKKKIELVNAWLFGSRTFADTDRVYVNGYQSWTTSREYKMTDVQEGLRGLGRHFPARKFTSLFGDYSFQNYTGKPGKFHSYSYTYVNGGRSVTLCASLEEKTGFTIFHYDMANGKFDVQKDVEGVGTDKPYVLFNLYRTEGKYDEVFDAYFAKLGIRKPKRDHLAGYTSWYNYYGTISEEQISRDIDGLAKVGNAADIFQIDDGYQTAVGDWTANEKFPHGMRPLVDKIHEKGYLAGLWMAPFNATFKSKVAKEHPDWCIKMPGTDRRQLGVISWGGGWTLDFYNEDAAAHIKSCFDRVLDEWNFDLVKLDFLYSVCQTPRKNKSRGEIMCDAMDFLRSCVGDKLILGCGVPLFPAFGKVDACRISSDVAPSFADAWYIKHTNMEVVSAKSAMNNTVFRRHLNGRAFINDPDVFYLRNNDFDDPYYCKLGKLKFTEEQKMLLAEVNNMCGDVLFVSDDVGKYDDRQMELVKKFFAKSTRKVLDAEYVSENEVAVTYLESGKILKLKYNVLTGVNTTTPLGE